LRLEESTVIWLIGLISTDGQVLNQQQQNGVSFRLFSVEEDWLQTIQNSLNVITIKSTFHKPSKTSKILYLNNPYKICMLFDKYNCKSFCNPRKWKLIKEAIDFYKSSNYYSKRETKKWIKYEKDVIKNNYKIKTDKEIGKILNRKISQIKSMRQRMKLLKRENK